MRIPSAGRMTRKVTLDAAAGQGGQGSAKVSCCDRFQSRPCRLDRRPPTVASSRRAPPVVQTIACRGFVRGGLLSQQPNGVFTVVAISAANSSRILTLSLAMPRDTALTVHRPSCASNAPAASTTRRRTSRHRALVRRSAKPSQPPTASGRSARSRLRRCLHCAAPCATGSVWVGIR